MPNNQFNVAKTKAALVETYNKKDFAGARIYAGQLTRVQCYDAFRNDGASVKVAMEQVRIVRGDIPAPGMNTREQIEEARLTSLAAEAEYQKAEAVTDEEWRTYVNNRDQNNEAAYLRASEKSERLRKTSNDARHRYIKLRQEYLNANEGDSPCPQKSSPQKSS